MELRDIDVLTILPQRPPFVMIDRLVDFTETTTVTELTVREDNLFYEDGYLNPCALVENIAQTCAARIGYVNHYIYQRSVKLGFIGGIKNLEVFRPVTSGEKLVTSIEVIEDIMNMTLVSAMVKVNGELVVTAEMKIALSNIDSQA